MPIYLPLLNEGTNVWRPVEAEQIGEDRYRIVQDQPEDEDWPVLPGTTVRCARREFANGQIALAAVIPD